MHVHRVAKCIHLFEIFSFGCKLGRLPRLAIQKYSERKKGKIDALEIRPRTETNQKASSGGEVTREHATSEWSVVENGDSTAVAYLVRSIKQKSGWEERGRDKVVTAVACLRPNNQAGQTDGKYSHQSQAL